MKRRNKHTLKNLLFVVSFYLLTCASYGQSSGRVVINEYMPWTLNGCGATSEFVELLNFGPGPINIGCYVLTDGDYSVTIPPNTILQPGEFYLIAGQDVITAPCANVDSTVYADLNWNTCGCTNAPIPTTGGGFFTDGGSANEQVVLLNPDLKVVDAVVRALPAEPSAPITPVSLECNSRTFNLDTIIINYEVLGMSAGRGNSFARKLDGDCGWVKDPQQSGNATNNTSGETSNVSYNFTIVQSMDCDTTHGSIDVYVNVGSSTEVFPMNYTIAFDSNRDGLFDFSDTYTYGVDSTPPSIAVKGLPLGRYRLTVSSLKGCFLQTFEFSILNCSAVLPTQLAYFNLLTTKNNAHTFEWLVSAIEEIEEVRLEKSSNASVFVPATSVQPVGLTGTKHFTQIVSSKNNDSFYRLRLKDKKGIFTYSKVITISKETFYNTLICPNPAQEKVTVQFFSTGTIDVVYRLFSLSGSIINKGIYRTQAGTNTLHLPVHNLPPGIYQLSLTSGGAQPILLRFVKQ